jgi:hypothetical protein
LFTIKKPAPGNWSGFYFMTPSAGVFFKEDLKIVPRKSQKNGSRKKK